MGMFDSVYITCPKCGDDTEFQSKAGPCMCNDYRVFNAPLSVLASIVEGDVYPRDGCCEHCGHKLEIIVQKIVMVL